MTALRAGPSASRRQLPDPAYWRGRRVLLTGHTGFKGSWLALWLQSMGATVRGLALEPPTVPSLFVEARVASGMDSLVVDVADRAGVQAALSAHQPEVVLHLAAQSLVRHSYVDPVTTYVTNVLGTVNVLEATRHVAGVRAIVNVTTDKCYENQEWLWGYRENEAMGGRDPYSSSKGCAELVSAAYRDSFLRDAGIGLATARAGNVVGGGDWAQDRLVPDFFRAAAAGTALRVRHPEATRPWQHVLEPLAGYLMLAERLHAGEPAAASAFNFGPSENDVQPVAEILDRLTALVPGTRWHAEKSDEMHEAGLLKLDSAKARSILGWRPRFDLERTLATTAAWFEAHSRGEDMRETTLAQIAAYTTPDTA